VDCPHERLAYDHGVEFGLVLAGAFCVILTLWVCWTAARLDRLGTRTESARASLDAQLVRRAAAAQALADLDGAGLGPELSGRLRAASRAALESDDIGRELAENELSRVLGELPTGINADRLQDLTDAIVRVALARRFYNDAVRDTRSLRSGRLARVFRLAAGQPTPTFFEIADAVPLHREPPRQRTAA
jgi:hypothetical protein